MSATYRTSFAGGGTSGTGDRSVTITPASGDLIVVFVSLSVNAATLTMTDDNGVDGTYTRVASALWNASANNSAVFVRNALIRNTDSTIITCTSGANDAGELVAVAVTGMTRVGLSAIRSYGLQANQASSTTPTPVLNQSALNTNLTMTAVASGDTSSVPNASWTSRQDANQATPTTALSVATRDSGFSGTSIAYAATQGATFASFAIELDGSAASVPQLESILKSYFETGDQPNQTQFEEFIGTLFALYVDAKTTANEAAADAADAVSHAPMAMVAAHYVSGTSYVLDAQSNVASIETRNISGSALSDVGNRKLRVNFTAPLASVDYVISFTPLSSSQSWSQVKLIAKTVDYFEVSVTIAGSGGAVENVEIIVFMP